MRKTHYGKVIFSFTSMALFPPLDQRNTRDKAKGLRITSERYIGELGARYLSTISRGQDSRQQSPYRFAYPSLILMMDMDIGRGANQYKFVPLPI